MANNQEESKLEHQETEEVSELPGIKEIADAAKHFFDISATKFRPLDFVLHETTKLLLAVLSLGIVGGLQLDTLSSNFPIFLSYMGFCFLIIGLILCLSSRNTLGVLKDMRTIRAHLKDNFSDYVYYRYKLDKIPAIKKKQVYETIRGLFTAKFDEMGYVCYRSFKVGLVLVGASVLLFILTIVKVVLESTIPITSDQTTILMLVFLVCIVVIGIPVFKKLKELKNKELKEYLEEGERRGGERR